MPQATYTIEIDSSPENLLIFAHQNGYSAQIQDPLSIAAIEAAQAAGEPTDNIVAMMDNPETAEEYSKKHIQNVIIKELNKSSDAYIEVLENQTKNDRKQAARDANKLLVRVQ